MDLVHGLPDSSWAMVARGPAGIGKTHFLTGVVQEAGRAGVRTLQARPSEAESRLGGATLVDLLETVTDAELDRLPGPQRDALAAAALRRHAERPVDPTVVAVALARLVQLLAEERPLLIAVDDAAWIDGATAAGLESVLRRLPARGVGVLLGLRTGPDSRELPEVILRCPVLTPYDVRPVTPRQLEQLILRELDPHPSPWVLSRAVQLAEGNPLFALELARSLEEDEEIPAPTLKLLVGERIAALSRPAQETVAAAAALRRPTTALLDGLGLAHGLPEAERAGIVSVRQGQVTFTHPLLSAASYSRLTGSERDALHARLIDVVSDVEERARHLMLAGRGPDPETAAHLDRAVLGALARGATDAALEAARLALAATPPGDGQWFPRALCAGRLLFRAGLSDQARELLAQVAERGAPHVRAQAHYELAVIARDVVGFPEARRQALLSLRHADDGLRVDVHLLLACLPYLDLAECREHARAALELARTPRQRALALVADALARFKAGQGLDGDAFREAMELEDQSAPLVDRAAATYAGLLVDTGDLELARELLDRLETDRVAEGDDGARAWLLGHRVKLELWSGHWAEAERLAGSHDLVASATAQGNQRRYAARSLAMVALAQGRLDEARELAQGLLDDGDEAGGLVELMGQALLGEVALAEGDFESAARHLARAEELQRGDGVLDPAWRRRTPLYVQVLAALGRVEEAEAVLAEYAGLAQRVGRPLNLALARRAEAHVLAARGDLDGAIAAVEEVLEVDLDPLEDALTRVLHGQLLRRNKQKAPAREVLADAAARLEALGAILLAERARGEGRRTGLLSGDELTATERQVALLTAQGLRGREVAAQVFLSPKTVEAYLTRIYRKLGLRGRGELAAWAVREQRD